MSAARIAIVVHERDPYPRRTPHCLWRIADVWREQGHRVDVVHGTRGAVMGADLLIPQVDRTRTPRRFVRLMERHPRVVNRRVVDISKRRISRNLLLRDSDWEGPVIVKTDRNYGGLPESKGFPRTPGELLSRVQRRRRSVERGDFRWVRAIPTGQYPVFPRLADVPRSVWSNRHLVVERFLPEKDGEHNCIRICLVLGSVVLNRRIWDRRLLIKGTPERSEEAPVPEALLELRRRLGLDYGKVDYVMHDGELHVLDANRSPSVLGDPAATERICRKLAAGLDGWLRGELLGGGARS